MMEINADSVISLAEHISRSSSTHPRKEFSPSCSLRTKLRTDMQMTT
jgi:hypothetical protein